MKKISIGVIAALVLLYPALTWLVGSFVEHRFEYSIAQMRDKAPYATVVAQHFHRGWYSSESDVTVEVLNDVLRALPAALPMAGPAPVADASAGAKPPVSPLRITIRSVIHHGPICGMTCIGLARVDSHVEFSALIQPAITKAFGSNEPLSIRSRLGFFGGGSTAIHSPAFADTTLDAGGHAAWGGLDATISYGADYDSGDVHATAPRIMYSDAAGKRLELSGLELVSRTKRALRSLYAGDTSLAIARVAVAGPGGAGVFSADDLRLTSQSSADQGFMIMSVKFSTGAITTTPITLSNLHYDLTFRHVDMESLDELTTEMRQLNKDGSGAPAERTAKVLAVLQSRGGALLAHQPEIAVDRLSVATANGGATLTGLVRLPDVTAADFAAGADIRVIVQKLDAEFDVTLDDAFMKSLPGAGANSVEQLQVLADRGLFTHDSAKFHSKILFRHGQATFNGKSFGPPGAPAAQPMAPSANPPLPMPMPMPRAPAPSSAITPPRLPSP